MRPISSRQAVLNIITSLIIKHRKTYCWPKISTFREILSDIYNIKIADRTVYYHLQQLRELKLIKCFRRYGRRADGTLYNKPSNRQITITCIAHLKKSGVWIPKWLLNWAYKGELPEPVGKNDEEFQQRPAGSPAAVDPVILKQILDPLLI